jgi:DNA-binding transcriptional MerR regulator
MKYIAFNRSTSFPPRISGAKMKISELSRRTNVPKETIHYYVREGFIPRPRKKGKNVSDYDESFIERILLIKQIQDHFFLPLSLIKKIVKQRNKFPELKSLLELRTGYFSPLDQFLQKEVAGEDALAKATGMAKKWITKFEEWGVISSVMREGQKVYSQDDVIIGKLLVDLDRAGFGPKDGVDPESARRYTDVFRQVVKMAHGSFMNTDLDKFTAEENLERGIRGRELMGVFFYHLYRKLVRDEDWSFTKDKAVAARDGASPVKLEGKLQA